MRGWLQAGVRGECVLFDGRPSVGVGLGHGGILEGKGEVVKRIWVGGGLGGGCWGDGRAGRALTFGGDWVRLGAWCCRWRGRRRLPV